MTDKAIFGDTSRCIGNALEELHKANPSKTGLSSTALNLAVSKLI
jgi:hypothetical protein